MPIFISLADQSTLRKVEVEYETMEGWKGQATSGIRRFDELPKNAQDYVKRIETLMNVHSTCTLPHYTLPSPHFSLSLLLPLFYLLLFFLLLLPYIVRWVGTGPSRDDMIDREKQ